MRYINFDEFKTAYNKLLSSFGDNVPKEFAEFEYSINAGITAIDEEFHKDTANKMVETVSEFVKNHKASVTRFDLDNLEAALTVMRDVVYGPPKLKFDECIDAVTKAHRCKYESGGVCTDSCQNCVEFGYAGRYIEALTSLKAYVSTELDYEKGKFKAHIEEVNEKFGLNNAESEKEVHKEEDK